MFSVIIPVYNGEQSVSRAILSVFSQTYRDYEIIIINDGSSDNSARIVESFNSSKIRLINQTNHGVSIARNNGILQSKFDFICFLDCDDEWKNNHLSTLKNMINKFPDENVFITTPITSNNINGVANSVSNDSGKIVFYEDFIAYLNRKNLEVFNTNSICVRKNQFHIAGYFEPNIKNGEDTDMWYRLFIQNNVIFTDCVTTIRHRDFSVATKSRVFVYDWIFEARYDGIMNNPNIQFDRKISLSIYMNKRYLSKCRNYLLSGDRKSAIKELKNVKNTKMIKFEYFFTLICFLIPVKLLRIYIKRKHRNYYSE